MAAHREPSGPVREDRKLKMQDAEPRSAGREAELVTDRLANADPDETVTVTGVGSMTLWRAVHKYQDWRDHHGLGLALVYRDDGKEPPTFDMADLSRLAELDRFR